MIDTKSVKARFLSLAFQGQLVAFSRQEIQNDTLENLHRKQKNYSPVSESEYLINTPSNWNWSRLGYVTSNHGQIIPNEDFCYIDVGTLDNVHQRLSETENIVSSKDAPSRARKVVQDGDILYSTVRPYLHNICVVDRQFSRMPIASTAFCVMQPDNTVLLNKFLLYWLLTPEFDKFSNGDPSKGTLYPAIGEKDLLHGVIPIPSLAEQALIIERIESVFSVLDTIDNLQSQYINNQAVLKEKLIEAAIRGKLTEQLPEDGTAEELYQQIQAEKQNLIKFGKLKKEKELPEIKYDEKPFEIPKSWKWVYLGDLFQHNTGKALNSRDSQGKMLEYITTSNLYWDRFELKELKTMPFTDSEIEKCTITKGDLLVCEGGDIGRSAIWPYDYEMRIQNHIHRLRKYSDLICTEFYYYLLLFYKQTGRINGIGIGLQGFSSKRVHSLIVPIAPFQEQKRIVTKLDEMLKKIEMEKINV